MHKLVLKNITVEDHRRRIVDDVSLETEGDLLVIGESGAGKTTLLKAMAGLLDDEGQVNLDERDISSLPSHARHMSMIFQKAALLPHVKVRENIGYGLQAAGYSRSEIRNMVEETASLLHIQSLLERYPAKLSGGEAQRVDMARAIVRRPDVLLMDEPFSSLDRRLAWQLEKEIASLCEKFDIMRVMVSHEMEDAMRFTGKIVYLSHGRLIEEGTADSLMDRPQQLETARFFGQPSMQETVCTVRNHHGKILQEDMETELEDGTYTALFRPYWIEAGKGPAYAVQSCRRHMDHYEVILSDGILVCTHVSCDTVIAFCLKKVLLYNTEGQLCSIWTG